MRTKETAAVRDEKRILAHFIGLLAVRQHCRTRVKRQVAALPCNPPAIHDPVLGSSNIPLMFDRCKTVARAQGPQWILNCPFADCISAEALQ